jgi:hypothetical protein
MLRKFRIFQQRGKKKAPPPLQRFGAKCRAQPTRSRWRLPAGEEMRETIDAGTADYADSRAGNLT